MIWWGMVVLTHLYLMIWWGMGSILTHLYLIWWGMMVLTHLYLMIWWGMGNMLMVLLMWRNSVICAACSNGSALVALNGL